MTVLALVEAQQGALAPVSLRLLAAAGQLGPVTALVAGEACRPLAEAVARVAGVEQVLLAEDPGLAHGLPEPLAALAAGVVQGAEPGFSHVLAPATHFGQGVLPRLAVLCHRAPISGVVAFAGPGRFLRPVHGGHALTEVSADYQPIPLTIRPSAFAPAELREEAAPIQTLAIAAGIFPSRILARQASAADRPELTTAQVVVAGGLGIGSAEGFSRLAELADRLAGAVGASRCAIDAGFCQATLQIGQTGTIIGPDLYLGFAVSGAWQHLAGIKDAKVIVAINHDPEAPIFAVADYAWCADWQEAVRDLLAGL